jgi:uncharacterized protein (TIGR02246 family)
MVKIQLSVTVFTFCCVALLVHGCTQQQPDTRVAEEQAIRGADSAWSAASAAKDVDRWLSYLAPDALIFPPNSPTITGLEAIRSSVVQGFASPGNMNSKTDMVEVSRSGDLGYTYGAYEYTFKSANGETETDRGKYLTVWKKQADGKWKALVDIYNSDLPLTPPSSK